MRHLHSIKEIWKTFLRLLPFSRLLAKTLKLNKISMKIFSKICRSESSHTHIWNQHSQQKWCEQLNRNSNWRIVIHTYVMMTIRIYMRTKKGQCFPKNHFWCRFWSGKVIGPYFFQNRVCQDIIVVWSRFQRHVVEGICHKLQ